MGELPKTIPCPQCGNDVDVINRSRADGRVQYLRAQCACGEFLDVAGHGDDEQQARGMALISLRNLWSLKKKTGGGDLIITKWFARKEDLV